MEKRVTWLGNRVLIGAAVALLLVVMGNPMVQAQQGDTTAPRLSLPGSITLEATSRSGVVVTFPATATDAVDRNPLVACLPPSGSVFSLGTTTVKCTATDAAGNATSGSFPVTVRDITPPVLNLPASFKAEASSRLGALVVFTATASDTVDQSPAVVCNPSSGSVFPLGSTTVSCTATDGAGNVAGNHFLVTVEDTSPPTITGRPSPASNANGWNNTDVAVTFLCVDTASRIIRCDGDTTLTVEGAGQRATGAATDAAGMTSTTEVGGINIDKTPPLLVITSPAQGAEFLILAPVTAAWRAEDGLSGVGSASGSASSGAPVDTGSLGLKAFTVTATDLAGNRASVTHAYTVLSPFAVFTVEQARVEQEVGAPRNKVQLEGIFEVGSFSDGTDLAKEDISVTFNGFSQLVPAAAFTRDSSGQGYKFDGVVGGFTHLTIQNDGRFKVKAEGLDLPRLLLGTPVTFSLKIGGDVGHTTILLTEQGPFRLETRQPRDFFGTVVSASRNTVQISTEFGSVAVAVTADAEIRVPHKAKSGVGDLVAGDVVAVSLDQSEGILTAGKIVVIPGKGRTKHLAGRVIAMTDTQLTIQPVDTAAPPVIFRRTPATRVRFHRGERDLADLKVGSFVVIATVWDAPTGRLSLEALEINVTAAAPEVKGDGGSAKPTTQESFNPAKILGVFQGVDQTGNWIVGGTPVAVGETTRLLGGLAVGQLVEVEAELRPDGSLLAREIEKVDPSAGIAAITLLEGVFEGIDPRTGGWLIAGIPVIVSPHTATDGLPVAGQIVGVRALAQPDGSLLAKEIENKGRFKDAPGGRHQVKLWGTLQRVDGRGNWIVNGVTVAVGPSTRLRGSPAVGQPVKVEAILQDGGSLFAQNIEGWGRSGREPRTKAEIRGTVQEILANGSLVVNGIPIGLDPLTELSAIPQVGDFVAAEAMIRGDRSLLAREVKVKGKPGVDEPSEPGEVEIQGTIQRVNRDGTLVVNGISVAVSPLSEVPGDLAEGAVVRLEGILQSGGLVLARALRVAGGPAAGGGAEVKVEGLVEQVTRNEAGHVVSLVVEGASIGLAALTVTEGELKMGARVQVKAIVAKGALLARLIEVGKLEKPQGGSRAEVAGVIESIQSDGQGRLTGVVINGFAVVIGPQTKLEGALVVGAWVKVTGAMPAGVLRAEKVAAGAREPEKGKRQRFEVSGIAGPVIRSERGDITSLVVDGKTIGVEALTRIQGRIEAGQMVKVQGVVDQGRLLAGKVEAKVEGLSKK